MYLHVHSLTHSNTHTHIHVHVYIQRIRRNISGQRPDANTRAIHINCFDVRRVKLLFILEDADQQTPHTQSQKLPSLENSELGQKLTRLASLAVGGGEKAESELASPSRSPRSGMTLLCSLFLAFSISLLCLVYSTLPQ